MATSIGKLSKSFLIKILVGIIILPFLFWGMGDVFRGGSQNVIASIDSEKVSTQEFMNYIRRLNLQEEQIKNLPKTDLIEKILAEYIGKRIMALEIESLGILINDNSLRKIIKNDEIFFKNNKFSRTEYEKFLIKSGISAPQFELSIVDQEKRRQFLSSLSGGVVIPDKLVIKEFRKENQIKTIQYIDLEKFYSKNEPSQKEMKELFERNKSVFYDEFKSFRYAELTPEKISGVKNYNENFFKQLDIIENNVLDGQIFDQISKDYNLDIDKINNVNIKKEDEKKNKVINLSDNFFNKIYKLNEIQKPEIINIEEKYYLVEILSVEKKTRSFDDFDVQEALKAQLNFRSKIENNSSINKDISMGAFGKQKFEEFSSDKGLEIKNYKIKDLKQNEIFSADILKKIFILKDSEISLITNNSLTKSFLVLAVKTEYNNLEKNSNDFEQYEAKARLNLINQIYQTHDINLNKRYKVELNQRTIERVKNSF